MCCVKDPCFYQKGQSYTCILNVYMHPSIFLCITRFLINLNKYSSIYILGMCQAKKPSPIYKMNHRSFFVVFTKSWIMGMFVILIILDKKQSKCIQLSFMSFEGICQSDESFYFYLLYVQHQLGDSYFLHITENTQTSILSS